MNQVIKNNLSQLRAIFQAHKVEKVYVFGSVVSQNFNKDSDIDFLISFEKDLEPLRKGRIMVVSL